MKENGNVIITPREMYDILLEMKNNHQEILSRLKMIESQLKTVHETDERSRMALDIAQEARAMAQRLENQMFWLWRTVLGAIIASVISALAYLLFGTSTFTH